MKQLLEKLIGRMKGDPGYRLDSSYTTKQMLSVLYHRGWQYLRGFRIRFWIKSQGAVFVGSRVRIEHGYLVRAGRSLILEDGVFINALSTGGVRCGDRVTIARDAMLVCTGVVAEKGIGISIGNNSAVGAQSFLGGQGGIQIGDDVIMGPQVKIFSENHVFDSASVPIRTQGQRRKGVSIGNDCWIGAGVTILDGVSIGDGCVVAAASVVTESLDAYSVAMGAPARVVKTRR